MNPPVGGAELIVFLDKPLNIVCSLLQVLDAAFVLVSRKILDCVSLQIPAKRLGAHPCFHGIPRLNFLRQVVLAADLKVT